MSQGLNNQTILLLTFFLETFSFTMLAANSFALIQLFHLLLRFEQDVLMVLPAVLPEYLFES